MNNNLSPIARKALVKVIHDDLIWILFEYEQENLDDGWQCFNDESEIKDFIHKEGGEPIVVPQPNLSAEVSKSIKEQAQLQVTRAMEEVRKLKVRSEIALKEKESELKQVRSTTLLHHQSKIDGGITDTESKIRGRE